MFPKAKSAVAAALLLMTSLLLISAPAVRAPPDLTPPWVISYSPQDHQVQVPLDAPIYVNFSEPMNPLTFRVFIVPNVALSPSWLMGMNLTLDHTIPFATETQYTVTVNGTDLSGNPLDGNHDGFGGDPLTWVFWTFWPNGMIIETWPPDGAFDVPLDTPIFVNFSGSMDPMIMTVFISPPIAITMSWNPTFTSLRIDHAAPFAQCTKYTVSILSQGPLPQPWPGPGPNPWSFTTTGCGPMIIAIDPPQNNAPIDASIVVTFNVAMDKSSIKVNLTPAVLYVMGWANTDKVLYINHTEKFKPCTAYKLTVSGNDTLGRGLGPSPVPNPYEFNTTCTYPRVMSNSPPGGATGVALDAPIIASFSESMDNKSVEDSFYCNYGGTSITVTDGAVSWNPEFTVFTFNTSVPFHLGSWHTVVFNSSLAHGLGDNYLDGNGNGVAEKNRGDDYLWQFKATDVAEPTPPSVESVNPRNGDSGVSRDPTVVVIFSEAMNKSSVEKTNSVSVWLETGPYGLAHDFSWPNKMTVSFHLIPRLSYGIAFTIKISRAVSDLAGNQMGEDYSWSFTVAPWRGDAQGRVVDDADGSPIANATVTFQGIQTLTDANGNFTLEDVSWSPSLLNVSKEGYESYSYSRNVTDSSHDLGTVRLRKTPQQPTGPSPIVLFAALLVTVLLVLLLLFLLSKRRQKSQPTKFEEWKGEVAVMEREEQR